MSLPWRDLQRTEGSAMPRAPRWAAHPGVGGRAGLHHIVTAANAPSALRADEPSCAPPAASTLPTCMHQVGTGDTGTWPAAEKVPSRAVSRALGRYLQQAQGAEALEGQRRDALQGVVAEDPAEGKQATQLGVLQETHPGLHAAPAPSQTTASPKQRVETLVSPAPPSPQGPLEHPAAAQCGTAGTSLTGW